MAFAASLLLAMHQPQPSQAEVGKSEFRVCLRPTSFRSQLHKILYGPCRNGCPSRVCTCLFRGLWSGAAGAILLCPSFGSCLHLAGRAVRAPTLCVLARLVHVPGRGVWPVCLALGLRGFLDPCSGLARCSGAWQFPLHFLVVDTAGPHYV